MMEVAKSINSSGISYYASIAGLFLEDLFCIMFLNKALALENCDLLVLSVMPKCMAISLCEKPSIA
jgi:hypothetical protein